MLKLRLLGPPNILAGDREVHLPSQKAQALLYYLAAEGDRPFSRSHVIALLWEESSEREGRNSLSTVLTRLRQTLPVFPLVADGDTLAWQTSPDVWVDTALVARELKTAGEGGSAGQSAQTGDRHALRALEEIADLWRGSFLEGFAVRDSASYEEWLRLQREHWQQRWLGLLWRLVQGFQAAGDFPRAIVYAQKALAVDPLQERFHRAVMNLRYQAGDRAAALAQYRVCVGVMREELGAEPDPETSALYEAILQGRLSRPLAKVGVATPPPPVPVPPPAIRRPRPVIPLVGRQPELTALLRHLTTTAQSGQGRLVAIQGEAGIGKSRLVEELLWRITDTPAGSTAAGREEHASSLYPGQAFELRPSGPKVLNRLKGRTVSSSPVANAVKEAGRWTILVGHSHEAEQGLAYHPFIEALEPILPYLDYDLLGVPDVWLAEVNRLLPDLATYRPSLPTPLRLDPQHEQRRLFEGIARFMAALCMPLLVVLEDLHWADEGTLQLLAYLVRHEAARPILFLITLRAEDAREDLTGLLRTLEREERLAWLSLGRLTSDATVALSRWVWLRWPRLRAGTSSESLSTADTISLLREMAREGIDYLGERLYRETEGNPLFAVETVRSLIESGALQTGSGGADLSKLVLPDSVQAVIQARLARLEPHSREFLNAASIFRRGFDFEETRAVSGQSEDTALDALEALLKAQIVYEYAGSPVRRAQVQDVAGRLAPVAPGSAGGESQAPEYVFGHDKIRQVVYEELSNARQRVFHRRVVDFLRPSIESAGAMRNTLVERLAYHAYQGQVWDQALEWSQQAAAAAVLVFAYGTASILYEHALGCLAHLPPTAPDRSRSR